MRLSNMEKKQIDAQAATLLSNYGYSTERDDYVNIVDFVQKLGYTVGNAQLDDSEDGFLAIQASDIAKDGNGTSNDKIIGVNAKRSFDWKRFIIAHEFAHSNLHYKAGNPTYLHRENTKGKSSEENDADYFAAALLMPKESFRRLYNQFKKSGLNETATCLQLAAIFKVPFDSVVRRVEEVA